MKALTMSYGGGRQTVAMVVLILLGKLPIPERIMMADTGREASETWEYLDQWVQPALKQIGLSVEIAPHSLANVDLYSGNGDLLIPAFTESGKLPTFCSNEWKAFVVRRCLRAAGYGPDKPIVTWIGMTRDEIGRMKPSGVAWQQYHWPLALDLRMSVHDCVALVKSYGWAEPPKSSCWMCPHRKDSQWRHLRDTHPADFAKALALDEQVYQSHGVRVHRSGEALANVDLAEPDEPTIPLFGDHAACDSGFCWV